LLNYCLACTFSNCRYIPFVHLPTLVQKWHPKILFKIVDFPELWGPSTLRTRILSFPPNSSLLANYWRKQAFIFNESPSRNSKGSPFFIIWKIISAGLIRYWNYLHNWVCYINSLQKISIPIFLNDKILKLSSSFYFNKFNLSFAS
jgi:hypothetical protein